GAQLGHGECGILADAEGATGVIAALLADTGAFHKSVKRLPSNRRSNEAGRPVVLDCQHTDRGLPESLRGDLEKESVLAKPAAFGSGQTRIKRTLQRLHAGNRVARYGLLTEDHPDRKGRQILVLETGVKTVLGTLTGQPRVGRPHNRPDARMAKTVSFLPF